MMVPIQLGMGSKSRLVFWNDRILFHALHGLIPKTRTPSPIVRTPGGARTSAGLIRPVPVRFRGFRTDVRMPSASARCVRPVCGGPPLRVIPFDDPAVRRALHGRYQVEIDE